jgi:hypothetical protein
MSLFSVYDTEHMGILFDKMLIKQKLPWGIIACTDLKACPVQSHASIELSYMASPPPLPDQPGL